MSKRVSNKKGTTHRKGVNPARSGPKWSSQAKRRTNKLNIQMRKMLSMQRRENEKAGL